MKLATICLKKLAACLAGAALVTLPGIAEAALTVQLIDGTSTVMCADGQACDGSTVTGNVSLSNVAIAGYTFSATIGVSKPVIGSAGLPTLQLSNLSLSGPSSGSLIVLVSDTDFNGPLTPSAYQFSAGGTASAGSILVDAYADGSNTLFGQALHLDQLGAFSGPSFSGTHAISLLAPSSLYSLTMAATITPGVGGATLTGVNAQLAPVPLPGAALLFGSGLLGLVGLGRRRTA